MMNEQLRHTELLNHLKKSGQASVQDLVELFDISPATARRDINKLNELGWLRKVRNGAIYTAIGTHLSELNSANSSHLSACAPADAVDHTSEKEHIAEVAASLCQSGDSVIINCGTTAFMMGTKLAGRDVQVITNYLPLANHLIATHHEKVVILGGQYFAGSGSTVTPFEGDAQLYSANYLFTSGAGLTTQTLTKVDPLTVMAEQKMIKQADKLVALVDSSKLGVRSGLLFCKTSDIDILITGREADPAIVQALEKTGINILLA